MARIVLLPVLLLLLISGIAADDSCSFHQDFSCHYAAVCHEDENNWWCECPTDAVGDGLKNGTGCQFELTPCSGQHDCHIYGICQRVGEENVCVCADGYQGDGFRNCTDIDECAAGICSPDSVCHNSPGLFWCTCNAGFVGNGITCTRTCEVNHHCEGSNNFCNDTLNVCQCRPGYEGDAFEGCVDIDECARNISDCGPLMFCENLNGTYSCPCEDGYTKFEGVCVAKPRNCNDIKLQNVRSRDGAYEIDPDGPGGVPPFEVYCDFQPEYAITVLFSEIPEGQLVRRFKQNKNVVYKPTLPQVKALINSSEFCYQDMRFRCGSAQKLMNGLTYWVDGNGDRHYTWGGASQDQQCLCGQLGVCGSPSDNCYCNGQNTNQEDRGRIFDRSILPITRVVFGSVAPGYSSNLQIGNLRCGPRTFDFAENCHEYKFSGRYWIRKDTPMFIDVDGPEGDCDPILAHCVMERYLNVGVSVFYHDQRDATAVTEAGVVFDYNVPEQCIRKAVDRSKYCSQAASYQCTNSRLYNNGDRKGTLSVLGGGTIPFFAGGMGQADTCGCGVSGSCDNPEAKCNCDIVDGKQRMDLGVYHEKEYLPIGSGNFQDFGGNASGVYYVGPLECSEKQFGIPPSCLAARADGNTYSYNYLIDPDQGEDIQKINNVEPFNVYCEFSEDGISATTYLYHQTEQTSLTFANFNLNFQYYMLISDQVEALKRSSSYCYQELTHRCQKARIHINGNDMFQWTDLKGNVHSYFHGTGARQGCACNDFNNCTNNLLCDCDNYDDTPRFDYGVLTNMNDIPVSEVTLSGLDGESVSDLYVGPLICSENFPTCADINENFVSAERSFGLLPDGEFFVDPDGSGSLEPILVICAFPYQTILPVDQGTGQGLPFPTQGVSTCVDIEYSGDVSKEQIQALVASSAFCEQKVSYFCRNSPFTDKVTYKTCDGREQTGWGGSQGQPGCGCGVTGACDKCYCDNGAPQTQKDSGYIRAKDALPVCEVCFNLDAVPWGSPSRYSKVVVEDLVCYPNTGHVPGTCQNVRDNNIYLTEDTTVITEIDPDGLVDTPPLPVTCDLTGLTGVVVISPENPIIEVPPGGIDTKVLYFFLNFTFIQQIIDNSVYCEQALKIECFDDATFEMNANTVWQGADGTYQQYWAGNTGGIGCKDGVCNCGFQDGRERVDGGLLTEDDPIPIAGVRLAPSNGARRVSIGDLRCYVVYKDCDDILKNTGGQNSPSGGKLWPIDPDGSGGVDPFVVNCDFYSHRYMGITVVPTSTNPVDVTGANGPGFFDVPVDYLPTPEQINALTTRSEFCYQDVQFTCTETPLLNDQSPAYGFLTGFNGTVSPNFGATDSSIVGCACALSGTCPADKTCRCDDLSDEPVLERGVLLNRDIMPITKASFSGQEEPNASGKFEVGDVNCAPEVFGVPADCEEARQIGLPSGDTLIRPNNALPPIMVYCDMREEFGVTIVGNTVTNTPGNVTYPGKIEVDYFEASELQLRSLVQMSVCYQPVKYDCKNTKFLEDRKAFWRSLGTDEERRYWGHANPWEMKCSCGHDRLCAGTPDDGKQVQRNRRCNCDTNDDVWRSDAGILSDYLPIDAVYFNNLPDGAEGRLRVGYLYCAPQEFDLDECALGFHDCAPDADCINLPFAFECRCREGYRGWGLDRTKYFATGRVCYDDDECALNRCNHLTSNCVNLPGSYRCDCFDGFVQVDNYTCVDIDECANGNNACDENAQCYNQPGFYFCRCNRGYTGDGFQCEELGKCTCFGDPHCRSFDDKWSHFQGACQYTMARDDCNGTNPSFQVLQNNWRKAEDTAAGREVSWVKEVTIFVSDKKVEFKQNLVVFVDGYVRTLPVYFSGGIVYYSYPNVRLETAQGLFVTWNGLSSVEVSVTKNYKGKLCGLCGNFNNIKEDDWMTGNTCPPAGEITANNNLFGHSWAVETDGQEVDDQCMIDCDDPPDQDPCTVAQKQRANEYCQIIFSREGPFKDCLAAMSPDTYNEYRSSCIYDLCDVGNIGDEVCATAENFVTECDLGYAIAVVGWRSPSFCGTECKANEVFMRCGNRSQERYCVENTTQAISQDMTSQCEEGCFCLDGFRISGIDCIPEEECGCLYDGVYYKVNDRIVGDACSDVTFCNENKTLEVIPFEPCGTNEECKVQDGRRGCYCIDGFMRMPDGVCSDDPCYNNNCTANSDCVPTQDGYDCICRMGYTGFCDSCDDIDECLTSTDECDGRSECVNTIGSYLCYCEDGLIALDGKLCTDKDECTLGIHDCDEHAQCINQYKTYECICCFGYEMGANGTCVEVPGAGGPTGGDCCACVGEDCNTPGPVCGSDFKTYASVRDLVVSACLRDNDVTLEYRGECQSSCSDVVCDGWEVCLEDPATGMPICECVGCTEQQLEIIQEVCDESGNLFITMCQFQEAMCLTGSTSEPIPIAQCRGIGTGVSLTGWTEWSPCSVTCGKGEKERTRSWGDSNPSPGIEARVALRATTECYEPPCTGPCIENVCTGFGEECVEYDGVPQCECPECSNGGVDYVCALVGENVSTYLSECKAQRAACVQNLPFEILFDGICGVKPLECERVPMFVPYTEGDCYAEGNVNLWTCDGGCGRISTLCCDNVMEQQGLTINLICPNGPNRNVTVPTIKDCFCREDV